MTKEKMQNMIDCLAEIKKISYNEAKMIIIQAIYDFENEIVNR